MLLRELLECDVRIALKISSYFVIGLGDSSNSLTIVIVSVTNMTVIVKNYYCDSGHVVKACAFDIVSLQHTHKHV